jgi:hypothetical protein
MIIALTSGLLALASISVAAPASATTILDAAGQTIKFENADLEDINANEGGEILYSNVVEIDGTEVDALVTVVDVSEQIFDTTIDLYDDEDADSYPIESRLFIYDENFDPETAYTPADGFEGSMTLKVEFFLGGTEEPVTLQNVSFYVKDIDTYQYVEVTIPTSYTLDEETNLDALYNSDDQDIAEGSVRFEELNGVGSESDDQKHWVKVSFDEISTLQYTVGFKTPGGAGFLVSFVPVEFDNPSEQPGDGVTPVPVKISKKVFFDGDSAYLKPIWFKRLDNLIKSVPTCASNVTAKIISGVKKAKSEVKGSDLAQRRAAIVKKFLTKRGLDTTVTLQPNGKGVKAKNNQRFAKIVVSYNGANCD